MGINLLKKRWFWLIVSTLITFFVVLVPPVFETMTAWDIAFAKWLNSALGHNRSFDIFIAYLNSKWGDAGLLLLITIGVMCTIIHPKEPDKTAKQVAFWMYMAIIFIAVQFPRDWLEDAIQRKGPGGMIDGWYNLKEIYGINCRAKSGDCFPSGHTLAYIYGILITWNWSRKLSFYFLVIGCIAMFFRIMVGGHWATDIIGTIPLGLLGAMIAMDIPAIRRLEPWIYDWCLRYERRFRLWLEERKSKKN